MRRRDKAGLLFPPLAGVLLEIYSPRIKCLSDNRQLDKLAQGIDGHESKQKAVVQHTEQG